MRVDDALVDPRVRLQVLPSVFRQASRLRLDEALLHAAEAAGASTQLVVDPTLGFDLDTVKRLEDFEGVTDRVVHREC